MAGSTIGYTDGTALSAKFNRPFTLSADEGGNVYIADLANNRIRRIDWITRIVSTVAGNGGGAEVNGDGVLAEFNGPHGLIMKNGSMWVADLSGTVRHIGMMCITIQIYFNKSLNLYI